MSDRTLTTILILIGVAYHIMSIISKLRKMFPELTMKTIWGTFFNQEWDSLMVSALCLVTFQVLLYILRINEVVLPEWIEQWGLYLIAAVWGYAGQRLAYKALNTGEAILEKKVENLKDSNG